MAALVVLSGTAAAGLAGCGSSDGGTGQGERPSSPPRPAPRLPQALARAGLIPAATRLARDGPGAKASMGATSIQLARDGGFTARAAAGSFGLDPVGVGRRRLDRARPGRLRVRAGRAVTDIGPLLAWYRGGDTGLEQGFTLAGRPDGTGPLRIAMRVTGDLAVGRDGARSIAARVAGSGGTKVFEYGRLSATDSRGRRIPAHFHLDGRRVEIVVSDEGAAYPLRIDPTLTQQAALTPSGAEAGEAFGFSIALSKDGSTAIVGAPHKKVSTLESAGAAYVFVRSAKGEWTQQGSALTAGGEATANANFGEYVAISSDGSRAIVGSPLRNSGAGAAYIYLREGSTWTLQKAINGGAGQRFGGGVAIAAEGGYALIGAYYRNTRTGAATVYLREGTAWTKQKEWTGEAESEFGKGVALSADGSTALVGAPGKSWLKVFVRSGTTWTEQKQWTNSAGSEFGTSVALAEAGTTALAGAPAKNTNTGVAYVLTRSGTVWSQQAELSATGAAVGERFGVTVGLSSDGSTGVVGAPARDSNAGASYLFTRSGSAWSQQQQLTIPEPAAGDYAGQGLAVSGEGTTAAVGAYGRSSSAGAAYAFAVQTETALASSKNPSQVSQSVSFTATVSPVPDGGTVAFTDGGTGIEGCGAVAVNGEGKATCTTTYSSVGERKIKVAYSGNAHYVGSESTPLTQVVQIAETTTTLGSSSNPVRVGVKTTLTATVAPTPDGGTVAFTDGGSAIAGCGTVAVDGEGKARCETSFASAGVHMVKGVFSGTANFQTSESAEYEQVVQKAETTTALGSAPNPSKVGEKVTATATVTPTPNGGTMAFDDGGSAIEGCGAVAVDGEGKARCETSFASAGTHQLKAVYSGTPDYRYSISPEYPQVVEKTATTTALVSAINPSKVGEKTTLTATVAPVPNGGTVAFTDGGSTIAGCGTVAVDGEGKARCETSFASAGTHQLKAAFSGTASFELSTSPELAQVVEKHATATALTSAPNPSKVGQTATFTATVTPIPDGGTVAFAEEGVGIAGCGAVAVDGEGKARCETAFASAGVHKVKAAYSGNSGYLSSESATREQVVERGETTTTLMTEPNPSRVGQTVTLTATVDPVPGGGTILFTDGGSTIAGCGAVAVDGEGKARCETAFASAGVHKVKATFSGAPNYRASWSSELDQEVHVETTTALTSAPNPSRVGQTATLTATVAPTPDGGTVAFTDGGSAIAGCGTVAVDGEGKARCETSFASAGVHGLKASFSGTVHFETSESAEYEQVAQKAETTTALGAAPNPSSVAQKVTLIATVSPTPDGGTVAFTDGGSTIAGCGAVAVDGEGKARCETAFASAGTHEVKAAYAGNADYEGSESTTYEQLVQKAATTTALGSAPNPSRVGEAVVLTATVSPVPGGGTILFTDGGSTIAGCGAVAVDGEGKARCETSFSSAGTHEVKAAYAGNADYEGSESTTYEQLVRATTTTGLVSSTNPSGLGAEVTFTATVSPVPGGGTVRFDEQGTAPAGCAAVAVAPDGTAKCPVSFAHAGSHEIKARYSGDPTYYESESSPLNQQVEKGASSTSLTSSPNPSKAGETTVLTASVAPPPGGGTVQFSDGSGIVVGCEAVPIAGDGTATCYASFEAGAHSLRARFGGSPDYLGSESAELQQTTRNGLVQGPAVASIAISPRNPAAAGRRSLLSFDLGEPSLLEISAYRFGSSNADLVWSRSLNAPAGRTRVRLAKRVLRRPGWHLVTVRATSNAGDTNLNWVRFRVRAHRGHCPSSLNGAQPAMPENLLGITGDLIRTVASLHLLPRNPIVGGKRPVIAFAISEAGRIEVRLWRFETAGERRELWRKTLEEDKPGTVRLSPPGDRLQRVGWYLVTVRNVGREITTSTRIRFRAWSGVRKCRPQPRASR